jgi:membrane glycosyltransferase
MVTIRILIILGNVFENKNCIFVIYVVLGSYVSVVFWTCIVFLLNILCGKIQFTAVIMPDFLLELTRI